MKKLSLIGIAGVVVVCLFINCSSIATAQIHSTIQTTDQKKESKMKQASGTFEVDLTPQQPDEGVDNPAINRMTIVKHFDGDLEADSKGQMLAHRTNIEGSAGYVAMEYVTGKLDRHSGSFVLQHSGIMDRSEPQLTVTVVPDSGTGELAGLQGKMTINIEDGKHFYKFEYTLPESDKGMLN